MDNTTLSEVTTMITDFNPNFTNFYPTLAVVNTLILDDMKVTENIMIKCNNDIIGMITTPTGVYKANFRKSGIASAFILAIIMIMFTVRIRQFWTF